MIQIDGSSEGDFSGKVRQKPSLKGKTALLHRHGNLALEGNYLFDFFEVESIVCTCPRTRSALYVLFFFVATEPSLKGWSRELGMIFFAGPDGMIWYHSFFFFSFIRSVPSAIENYQSTDRRFAQSCR
jgi:hypothetical protein